MGRIKKEILRKSDRPVTEPKPPSMRRIKRMNKSSVESSRAGRNSTLTPSRVVSLRGLRRKVKDFGAPSGTFSQEMPEMVVFRFKKKHRPTETVVHEHYSDERKARTSTRRVSILTCRADDSVRIKQLQSRVDAGLGKIETKKSKVIRHRIDKQDKYFKFHKHDVKF